MGYAATSTIKLPNEQKSSRESTPAHSLILQLVFALQNNRDIPIQFLTALDPLPGRGHSGVFEGASNHPKVGPRSDHSNEG